MRFDRKAGAEVGNSSRTTTQFLDMHLVNYFEEIDIPFFSLCVVEFLVKIHIKCIAIFLKAYFLTLKKKIDIYNYNPTEYNVISLVLFLFKTTCIILYCLFMIVYNLYKIKNYNHLL